MKKILLVLTALLLLTGCGTTDEEKEKMLYKSLEKAYVSIYATEGPGLAVYQQEKVELEGKSWFLVAISDYDRLGKLTVLAEDVYTDELRDEINSKLEKRYREIENKLYTPAEPGCSLQYELDGELRNNIKEDVKIKKIKMSKIVFEYNGKEYTAKKSKDNYVFSEKIFECK